MPWSGGWADVGLYDRVHGISGHRDAAALMATGRVRNPALDDIRRRIHNRVVDELGPQLAAGGLVDDGLRAQVAETLHGALADERVPLTTDERDVLVAEVCDDVVGFGPIDALLADDSVSEVMCNGPFSVWVERSGCLEPTEVRFVDANHLRRVIDKMVGGVGRRVDESTPLCDARLPDGARANVVLAPVAVGGPFLTVRKFSRDRIDADDLIRAGTLDARAAAFLGACVVGRRNIVVSGGTGSGKTTLLNVLSSFIPPDERIVTVEDSKELQFSQGHVVALEARPANSEGRGEITIRDLVRNSLRMRPDRIVVGEVRSGEALDMLQAMNTGHTGSLTTVHANSPRDALARLETLVLMAGFDLPVRAIREQLTSALDLVIQMERRADGQRLITRITEVQGLEGDVVVTGDLFTSSASARLDGGVPSRGAPVEASGLQPCGMRPRFAPAMESMGVSLPAHLLAGDGRPGAGGPGAGGPGAGRPGADRW